MGQSHHALNPTCSPLYTGSLECHTTCSVLAFTMAAPAPAQPPRSPTARCCQADVRACAGRGAPQAAFKLGGRPLSRSGAPALLPRGVAAMLDKAWDAWERRRPMPPMKTWPGASSSLYGSLLRRGRRREPAIDCQHCKRAAQLHSERPPNNPPACTASLTDLRDRGT